LALGLISLIGGIWLVIGQSDIKIPGRLAGLPLSAQATGQAALNEIERLHGQSFLLTGGAVARYGGGRTTVWISSTWLPIFATRQVEAMTNRIAAAKSPFTPVGTRQVEGVTVYVLTGMGQMHYYFQLDRQVIWLAVSSQLAEQSVEELIRELR
jgi:hypothetical protein